MRQEDKSILNYKFFIFSTFVGGCTLLFIADKPVLGLLLIFGACVAGIFK